MSKKGLGKGLDALFWDEKQPAEKANQQMVNISELIPNKHQPRRKFDEDSLNELVESIKLHGVLQPLAVRKLDSGGYEIIAGERRWRAARAAGALEVPVFIVEADESKAAELALVENLQREDLNPIEEAEGLRSLMREFSLTQEQAAHRVGRSRSAVANSIRLLTLADPVRDLLMNEKLSAGHAKALLALNDEKLQTDTANAIVNNDLSVRQTETLIKKLLQKSDMEEESKGGIKVNYLEEIERKLSNKLGRRVKLVNGRKKGRIELEYYGNDDLEALIAVLETLSLRTPHHLGGNRIG